MGDQRSAKCHATILPPEEAGRSGLEPATGPDDPASQSPRHAWSINGIDLVTLRLFATAVEEGTFSRTAERENIAVSAISRRISELEMRCGVPLLDRHDRGITATIAGEVMCRHIRSILNELHLMVRNIDDLRAGRTGCVRIQTHSSVGSTLLPGIVAEFVRRYPHIDIRLDELSSHEIPANIRAGIAEIGLVTGPIDDPDLTFIPWSTDDLTAILPKGHPLEAQQSVRLLDLLAYPFINMHRNNALLGLFRREAQALGKPMVERAHASSFASVKRYVAEGLGVAIVPALAAYAGPDHDKLSVRMLDEDWAHRTLLACVRNPEHLLGAPRLFLSHLLASDVKASHAADAQTSG